MQNNAFLIYCCKNTWKVSDASFPLCPDICVILGQFQFSKSLWEYQQQRHQKILGNSVLLYPILPLNRFYHPWNFSEYMRTFDCQLVYKSCHYGITLLALDYHFYYLGCDEKLVNCAWYCGENDSKSYVQNPVLKFADVYDGRIS